MTQIRRTISQMAIFVLVPTSIVTGLEHDWAVSVVTLFGAIALAL